MNACAPEPGSGGVCAPRNPRSATWSRRVRPWGNACRKVPGADGAAIPPNATGIAPCRGTSGSSMLSAPTARSATMLVALASAAERLIAVARWGMPDATKLRCGWVTVASRRPPPELRCAVSLPPPSVRSSRRGSTARGRAADRLCGGSGRRDVVHGDRQWAAEAPQWTLAILGARRVTAFAVRIAPSTAAIRRVLGQACPGRPADLLGADPAGAATLAVDGKSARLAHCRHSGRSSAVLRRRTTTAPAATAAWRHAS